MSRYGSATISGPASLVTRIVQSSEADNLAELTNAAIAALPDGYVVIGLTLAGAGAGYTFTVTIEAAATADAGGGFLEGAPTVSCYLASTAEALGVAHSQAVPTAGSTVADSQVVGASDGTRFMGMLVMGAVFTGGTFGFLGGSEVSAQTIAPNTTTTIATFGTSSNKPTGVEATFYALFAVSTPSGKADFQVELLIDGNPNSPPTVMKSSFTPPNPASAVVYDTTLSFVDALNIPDSSPHTYSVVVTTGPNTTVVTTFEGGVLRLLGTQEDFV